MSTLYCKKLMLKEQPATTVDVLRNPLNSSIHFEAVGKYEIAVSLRILNDSNVFREGGFKLNASYRSLL